MRPVLDRRRHLLPARVLVVDHAAHCSWRWNADAAPAPLLTAVLLLITCPLPLPKECLLPLLIACLLPLLIACLRPRRSESSDLARRAPTHEGRRARALGRALIPECSFVVRGRTCHDSTPQRQSPPSAGDSEMPWRISACRSTAGIGGQYNLAPAAAPRGRWGMDIATVRPRSGGPDHPGRMQHNRQA